MTYVLLGWAFMRASFSFMIRAPCNGKKIVPTAVNKDCVLSGVRSDHDFWTEPLLLSFSNAVYFFLGAIKEKEDTSTADISQTLHLTPKQSGGINNKITIFYFGFNFPFKFIFLNCIHPSQKCGLQVEMICVQFVALYYHLVFTLFNMLSVLH